jgi:hypothetical protein
MKDIFDPKVVTEFVNRIEKLSPESQAQWGKMNVSQMLAHCAILLETTLGEYNTKPANFAIRLMGRFFKPFVTSEKPFNKNTPTNPEFVVADPREFKKEKERFISNIKRLSQAGEAIVNNRVHPFFGKMNAQEWNTLTSKHIEHHLQQFGV